MIALALTRHTTENKPHKRPAAPWRLVALTCMFAAVTSMKAQIGEPRRGIAIGVNAGVAMNSVGFDPTIKQKMAIGPTFGLTLRLTSEKYFSTVCALQAELNYARLGWKEDIRSSADEPLPDTYSREQDWMRLPLLARLGWGRETKGCMGYIVAGPELGYLLGERSKRSNVWTLDAEGHPDRPNGLYAQYDMMADHRFDYGITAGAGLEISTSVGHFTLDGRYYYGLSDLYANSKRDVFQRSNNSTINIRLTWLFDLRKEKSK